MLHSKKTLILAGILFLGVMACLLNTGCSTGSSTDTTTTTTTTTSTTTTSIITTTTTTSTTTTSIITTTTTTTTSTTIPILSQGTITIPATYQFDLQNGQLTTEAALVDIFWDRYSGTLSDASIEATAPLTVFYNAGAVDFNAVTWITVSAHAADITLRSVNYSLFNDNDVFYFSTSGKRAAKVKINSKGTDLTIQWLTWDATL